eukprot:scaffold91360_cov18-Tisochrysis_lutea.AAC.1
MLCHTTGGLWSGAPAVRDLKRKYLYSKLPELICAHCQERLKFRIAFAWDWQLEAVGRHPLHKWDMYSVPCVLQVNYLDAYNHCQMTVQVVRKDDLKAMI